MRFFVPLHRLVNFVDVFFSATRYNMALFTSTSLCSHTFSDSINCSKIKSQLKDYVTGTSDHVTEY